MTQRTTGPGGAAAPRRRGIWPMVIGGVLLVVGVPAAIIIGLIIGGGSVLSEVEDMPRLDPGESLTLEAGAERTVYVVPSEGSSGTGPTGPEEEPSEPSLPQIEDCTVTGPDGSPVPLRSTGGPGITADGSSFLATGTFTAEQSGAHTIDCGAATRVLVAPAEFTDSFFQTLVWSIGGAFLGAGILGVVGLGLLIWGIVAFTNSKPPRPPGPQHPYGPPGPPPQHPYGPPGPPPQHPYGPPGPPPQHPYGPPAPPPDRP